MNIVNITKGFTKFFSLLYKTAKKIEKVSSIEKYTLPPENKNQP